MLIKESFSLIGWETQQATQVSPSLDDYLRAKKLRSLDSLYRYWWSNDPAIQLTESYNSPHLSKKVVSHATFDWWSSLCKIKNQRDWSIASTDIDYQRVLQSYWRRGTFSKPTKKILTQMLPAFGDYHHAKNLKDYWISSRDIDDQKFLGDLTGHTQQKVVVSDATFLWWLSLCKSLRYRLILSRDIDDQRIL